MTRQLQVDWPACRARGLCFAVLPEVIRLDDWGYPVVEGPVTEDLVATAREAVRMCPRLALRLVTTPAAPGNDGRRRPR
jgi:ferredoxin